MPWPDDWPLDRMETATTDADGKATVYLSVPGRERWRVHRMSTYGNTWASSGELRVWRGGGYLLGTSSYARADTSENDNLTILPGDVIRAEWSECDPGVEMRFTIEGIAEGV